MRLSNTSQYAIRILSYIANSKEKDLYSAKEVSEVLEIPYKFLTKIMTELVKREFIVSIRGREGGYRLARAASSITVLEILDVFNETNDQEECILGIGKCDGNNKCALHDQWLTPKSEIQEMFESTSLENLEGSSFKI